MTKRSPSRIGTDTGRSEPEPGPASVDDQRSVGRTTTHPVTPDGRYFVVRGRLWRMADPTITGERRGTLVRDLMAARRAVGVAMRSEDAAALAVARADVDRAKRSLGERGPVWWTDGAPDVNRQKVHSTAYAAWYQALRLGSEAARVEPGQSDSEQDGT